MRRSLPLLLLLAPGLGYLVLLFGLPIALALLTSVGLGLVGQSSGFTLSGYARLFSDPVLRDSLRYSVYISFAPTIVSLLLAVPLAVLLQKSFPGKALFTTLYKVPLVVPGIVAAFIVMILFDRGGEIARLIKPIGLSLPKLVRDDWSLGVILAFAWKSVPFMTLIIGGSLASVAAEVKAAARTLGAGPWTTLLQIELPLALPGITAATLLTFVGSTGAFAVPSLLGPVYPKPLSVWMYEAAYHDNDWTLASAMGIVLTLVAMLVLVAYYRVTAGLRRSSGGETR